MRRCWTEINLNTVVSNYKIYKKEIKKLSDGYEIMAVVKADAYGHGDAQTASALQAAGCRNFAVSNLNEALNLRNAGISGQLLILGYTPPEEADRLVNYNITQALLDEDYAEALADKGITAHFALDTGMNRIGLDADNPALCGEIIRKYAKRFNLTGLFTHLCVADTPSEQSFTEGQLAKFRAVCEQAADLKLPYVHCMNSAGALRQKPYGSLARLGIILYGLKPDYANVLPEGICPALEWKSVVSMVKTVHEGETIGYGRTFKAEKETRIATIPTGYADGYSRALSNKGCVIIRGRKAPLAGRVCMDQLTVDVSDIPGVQRGDEVILLGKGYTADDMAHEIGTIGYEIVCNISKRVERKYV